MAETVAVPLEQQINGVEDMLYMQSSSVGDGTLTITVTFKLGTDINAAQVLVQNRVSESEPRLPEETRAIGVTVRKASPDILMGVMFTSPDHSLDLKYLSNYVALQITDEIKRIKGVGDVKPIGSRDFAMRIWIDPDLAAARDMTVDEVVDQIKGQNVQVAAGEIGAPPYGVKGNAYQLGVQIKGRLVTPEEFGTSSSSGETMAASHACGMSRGWSLEPRTIRATRSSTGSPRAGWSSTSFPGPMPLRPRRRSARSSRRRPKASRRA